MIYNLQEGNATDSSRELFGLVETGESRTPRLKVIKSLLAICNSGVDVRINKNFGIV